MPAAFHRLPLAPTTVVIGLRRCLEVTNLSLGRHHAGIRQTNRLRQRYLGSVLRQEIGFFDTTATTGILLQVRE